MHHYMLDHVLVVSDLPERNDAAFLQLQEAEVAAALRCLRT